jgi:hypothetical protein
VTVAVPLRSIDCGRTSKLSEISRVPDREPQLEGAKLTLTAQVPLGGSGDPETQLSVSWKSPFAVTLRIEIELLRALVIWIV